MCHWITCCGGPRASTCVLGENLVGQARTLWHLAWQLSQPLNRHPSTSCSNTSLQTLIAAIGLGSSKNTRPPPRSQQKCRAALPQLCHTWLQSQPPRAPRRPSTASSSTRPARSPRPRSSSSRTCGAGTAAARARSPTRSPSRATARTCRKFSNRRSRAAPTATACPRTSTLAREWRSSWGG